MSANHNLFEGRAKMELSWGPCAYQPVALPLGQTSCKTYRHTSFLLCLPVYLYYCSSRSHRTCFRLGILPPLGVTEIRSVDAVHIVGGWCCVLCFRWQRSVSWCCSCSRRLMMCFGWQRSVSWCYSCSRQLMLCVVFRVTEISQLMLFM